MFAAWIQFDHDSNSDGIIDLTPAGIYSDAILDYLQNFDLPSIEHMMRNNSTAQNFELRVILDYYQMIHLRDHLFFTVLEEVHACRLCGLGFKCSENGEPSCVAWPSTTGTRCNHCGSPSTLGCGCRVYC